jgi:hypothetical protein
MNVERISDTMFTIGGQLVESNFGMIEFADGRPMTWFQLRAVLEFIDVEEQNLRILARTTVEALLKELGIKSYRDE